MVEFSLNYPAEMKKFIEFGESSCTYNRHGELTRIAIPVRHTKFDLFKEISGKDKRTLQYKLDELLADWQLKYEAHLDREKIKDKQERALKETLEAAEKIKEAEAILQESLGLVHELDWDSLKDKSTFDHSPSSNQEFLPKYAPPKIRFWEYIFVGTKKIKKRLLDYEREYRERKNAVERVERAEKRFYQKQEASNKKIDEQRKAWMSADKEAVIKHAELVLGMSEYPEWIKLEFLTDFDLENRILKVQCRLPVPKIVEIPKKVVFVKTTHEFKRTLLSANEQKKLYEDICYQTALRTVHELFEADTPKHFTAIAFNGVVDDIDLATGHTRRSLIFSALFKREEFEEIRLESVNPKKCFKNFGGVSSASLIDLAPIPPVVEFKIDDPRFVSHGEGHLENAEATNIAAMDWQEFEYFIRELFEKEFSSRAGKVKVTQASKDGGVDAVAFDPDPISGGKIVIQAKRYTNTVNVSAVRDLYGTVLNEGATKGILVSTADFGPDAYKFASDKPLSLLNGQNLLHLLEKHGIQAKIDLNEAKRILGLR